MRKFVSILTYGVAVLLILLAIVGDFIFFFPFRVTNSWVATVPNAVYHPGQQLTYSSSYIKTSNAPGVAMRYVVCNETSYLLAQVIPKREPGKRSGRVTITIPVDIVPPATCHIHVDIKYQIFGVRTLIESVDSNNFKLE